MALESSLASMLTAKTPKHPDVLEVRAQIDGLKKQLLIEIRRLFGNEIVELTKTSELLAANIRDVRKELERLAEVNRQLQDLQRQVGIAEATYLNLAAARDGALTAAATSYSNATVITWAELPDPSKPYYPQAAMYTILAIFVGLLFGFGMAFVVEFVDISVKDTEHIKQASGKIILGSIPKMFSLRSQKMRSLDTTDKFAGAILEIKHNVLEHLGDKKIIAVTSALRKEGKTKLICHLAVALAEDGHTVALVDLNLKKPGVHTVFGIPNAEGVSDVLTGKVEDAASIAQTYSEVPQLSIFPAGSRSESSIHKLGSPALKDFIASLERSYDYVLLDAAAVESLAGGTVVAALAQCTLLVVSVEGPSPQKLQETIHALENAGATLLGVIANRV